MISYKPCHFFHVVVTHGDAPSLIIARISEDLYNVYSSSPIFRLFPPYAGKSTLPLTSRNNMESTLSPTLTSMGIRFPSLSNPPDPAARTVPSDNFSCDFSGMKIPLEVFYR